MVVAGEGEADPLGAGVDGQDPQRRPGYGELEGVGDAVGVVVVAVPGSTM